MARVIEDGGSVATISKPLRPPSYEPNRVPDPITCAGAVIVINDRHNGELLPRLAVSSGAAWVRLAYASEVTQNAVTVDVSPLVRAAVRDMLPALVPRANPIAIAPPENNMEDVKNCARALLELAEEVSRIRGIVEQHDQTLIPVPENMMRVS